MRRALIAVVVASSLVAGIATAHASWLSGGMGIATSPADTMPEGETPIAVVDGTDVEVFWDASSFSDGTPVQGYQVRRYDVDTGDPQAVGAGCDGTVIDVTCTETGVPTGDWQYTVKPVHHNWQGTESSKSDLATVGAAAPEPTSLTIANGSGNVGRPDRGDVIAITFSEELDAASICSNASGSFVRDGSNIVTVRIEDDAAASGNDQLIVEVSTHQTNGCPTFQFGTIDLGSTGFVSGGNRSYGGAPSADRSSIAWNATNKTLTIAFGAGSGAPVGTVSTPVTATYTPHAGLTAGGVPVTGTASSTAVQF